MQFPDIVENFELKEIIFRREPLQDILDRMVDPHICGFSCYSWNYRYCLTLAEKIKQRWPDCKIIFGGSQVSGEILANKFIDSAVTAEGEKAFVKLLRQYLASSTVDIVVPRERIENLDELPSPYLTGIFDQIIQDHPDAVWAAVFETNRGCPYSCTFCDWGSLTVSKVKKFNLEKVEQELMWMARNRVAYLMPGDANFGIFKERDLEIAKMIRAAADEPGSRIESMNMNFTKNSSEIIFELARVLGSVLRGGITLSMQSMNPDTLRDIKRSNMKINEISNMLKLGEEYGINSYSEMIIGLPNETEETWKKGITDLLELGQHNNIDLWFAQLLINSELAQPQSRQKYGITSVQARDYITLENNAHYDECTEYIEIINGTNTMSTAELISAYLYSWMIIHWHITGYSHLIAKYCRNVKDIGYRQFYDCLFEKIADDPTVGPHFAHVKNTLETYLTTGILLDSDNFKGHTIHGMSYLFIYNNKDAVTELAVAVARELTDLSENIAEIQRNSIYDPAQSFPREIVSDVDLNTWEPGPVTYTLENKSADGKFDFYFSRRKQLLKNKFIKKDVE